MQSMQRAIYLHALHAYLINREYLIIFYVGGGGWGGGGVQDVDEHVQAKI